MSSCRSYFEYFSQGKNLCANFKSLLLNLKPQASNLEELFNPNLNFDCDIPPKSPRFLSIWKYPSIFSLIYPLNVVFLGFFYYINKYKDLSSSTVSIPLPQKQHVLILIGSFRTTSLTTILV